MTKVGWRESLLPQVMESAVRAMWKDWKSREKAKCWLGIGRVIGWNQRAALRYMHVRVGKGDLGQWRWVVGSGQHLCRLCGIEEETGDHLILGCEERSGLRPWD